MGEFISYPAILEEGRARGLAIALARGYPAGYAEDYAVGYVQGFFEATQNLLVRLGTKRFGPPSPEVAAMIAEMADLERVACLLARVLDTATWDELLAEG